MAARGFRGKLICLIAFSLLVSDLVCIPCLVLVSNSNAAVEAASEIGNPRDEKSGGSSFDVGLLGKQLSQLEELVKNLTDIVAKLESQSAEGSPSTAVPSWPRDEIRDFDKIKGESEGSCKAGEVERGSRAGPVLVTKYSSFWSERFQFVSAVRLSSSPNCLSILPFRDFEGLNKFFAVGDDKGRLFVFLRTGDVALEFDAFRDAEEVSPVASMTSYLSVYKNESLLVTGHENGAIVMHRVWETSAADEWGSRLHVDRVGRFETGGLRINMLEVHYVGRRRYILAVDGGGRVTVLREDGTVHGVVTPSRRLVVFLKQRLLFLTETGAGSLDLRTMKLKESECEGLNSSFAMSYVFDTTDRTRAYGFTWDGDLIHVSLLGDSMNFKCRVRVKRKLDVDEPLALQAIKGYLLIANREKVFVYNVSTQPYVRVASVRLLFSVGLNEIISSFLNQQMVDHTTHVVRPLIVTDYDKHVIMSLGNGYVAMYRSNLPIIKYEFRSIWWTSPVLFFVLFLFVVWHFFANKKDALTSWGPDISYNSSSVTGAPLGTATDERSLTDPSRNSERMDLRGSGLRGSSRYGSPPRYPGGAANSYRPVQETDPRPAPLDSRFRPGSELKFRVPNAESAGLPKRRDMRFVNNQVVDDGN